LLKVDQISGLKIWNLISPELKSLSFTKLKAIYKNQLIDTNET